MSRPSSSTPVVPTGLAFAPFLRRTLLFLVPLAMLWGLLTPTYNRLLTDMTERIVRLVESPPVTRLQITRRHHFLIHRSDLRGPGSSGHLSSVRVTDVHFPVLLTAALFLAVPTAGAGTRSGKQKRRRTGERAIVRKLRALALALLLSFVFHLLSLIFWVQFVYATQLGSWSLEHYDAFGRNFWGLGKHLLDLPFKFALPLLLWCAFYYQLLFPPAQAQ